MTDRPLVRIWPKSPHIDEAVLRWMVASDGLDPDDDQAWHDEALRALADAAHRLRWRIEAQDGAQEALLHLHLHSDKFRAWSAAGGSPGLVYKACCDAITNAVRRMEGDQRFSIAGTRPRVFLSRALASDQWHALRSVSPLDRGLLLGHYGEDVDFGALAREAGLSQSALERRLRRAVPRFRRSSRQSRKRVRIPWSMTRFLLLRAQLAVLVLQVHHHRDAGEVEPGLEQVADAAQPIQVVGAIAAGAALGALGLEQTPCLIGA